MHLKIIFHFVSDITTIHPLILDFELEQMAMDVDQVFIIGGKQVIMANLHMIDKIYLTVIEGTYDADVTLDLDDVLSYFKLVDESRPHNKCIFKEYEHETIFE